MPPRLHRFHVESATGRGLRLLEQLARPLGCRPAASGDGDGKVVWFEVGPATDGRLGVLRGQLCSPRGPGAANDLTSGELAGLT